MKDDKLAWEEIKRLYRKEWVELVDCDWPEESICPTSAVVRVHSRDRREFYKLAWENPAHDSAFIFVGASNWQKGN